MTELRILSTRGRKAAGAGGMFVERTLGEADLPDVLDPPKLPEAEGGIVKRLRSRHHSLARLVAQGVAQADICLITGYDPSRVSVLKGDPAFQELVAYYSQQIEGAFVDVHERMAALGLNALEELQSRLEENPEGVSNGQLMELVDMTFGPKAKTATAMGKSGGVSLNVVFAEHAGAPAVTVDGKVLEGPNNES